MKDRDTFLAACLTKDPPPYQDWSPGLVCRYCQEEIKPEDLDIAPSFWKIIGQGPPWSPTHKWCLKQGYRQEAHDCQLIDRDCNDCKYFKRSQGLKGHCTLLNKPVMANPGFCSDLPCFLRRLS